MWVFDVDALWCLIPAVSLLWALGGSGLPALRRLGIPILIALSAVSLGVVWWRIILFLWFWPITWILAYGDEAHDYLDAFFYPYLYAVGFGFTIPFAVFIDSRQDFIAFLCGSLANSFFFGTLTFTSQRFKFPQWKACELITGAFLGALIASII